MTTTTGYTAVYGGDPGQSGIYLNGEHVVDYGDLVRIGAQDSGWRSAHPNTLRSLHMQVEAQGQATRRNSRR
jgi:hypothetical protein